MRFREPQENKDANTKVKMKRYNAKAVAREKNSERYEKIKEELSKTGEEWNALHRKTMVQLWDELDDEEREECESTAKARNSGTIDEMEKRK